MNVFFEKYKDRYLGKRCFIIANGPSLKKTNLDLIKDEFSIAMNKVSLIYPLTKWRPTHYLYASTNVNNKSWGDSWTKSVQDSISNQGIDSFVVDKFKERVDPKNKYKHVNWVSSVTETKPKLNGEIDTSCFSTNIVDRIDKSGTSVNIALQMAYWFGFSEICFVGADLGWVEDKGTTNDANHFDPSYRANIPNPKKANRQMRNVHSLAHRAFKKNKPEVKIYNASKKTVLDIYPIIDFERYVLKSKITKRDDDMKNSRDFWDEEPQFGREE
jgi:hypothetical protein